MPGGIGVEVAAAFDAKRDRATREWLALVAPRSLELQALVAGCVREHRRRWGLTAERAAIGLREIHAIEDNLLDLVGDTLGRTRRLHASAVIQATYTSDPAMWSVLLRSEDDRVADLFLHRLRHERPRMVTTLIHALFDDGGERAEPLRRRLAGHLDPLIRCTASSICRSPARRVAERAAQRALIPAEWGIDIDATITIAPNEPGADETVVLPPAASIVDALTCGYQDLRVRGLLAARDRPDLALAFALGIELDAAVVERGYPSALSLSDRRGLDDATIRAVHESYMEPARVARATGRPSDQTLSPALERCLAEGPAAIADSIAAELGPRTGPDLEPWFVEEAALIAELPTELRRRLWPGLETLTPLT